MTSINGTISAGDRSADVDIAFKDVLKHLDMAVMMAAELRYKRWGFLGDLIYARLHDDIAPPAGILFSSTHDVVKETIGTFELSYRVVDSKKISLDAFAGARVYSFYSQIRLNPNPGFRGVNVSATNTWADPIIGLRGRYYVSRAVFLNLYGDIGGFGVGSDLSWQGLRRCWSAGRALVRRGTGISRARFRLRTGKDKAGHYHSRPHHWGHYPFLGRKAGRMPALCPRGTKHLTKETMTYGP